MSLECRRCEGLIYHHRTRELCPDCRRIVRRQMQRSRRYQELCLKRFFGSASKTRRFNTTEGVPQP